MGPWDVNSSLNGKQEWNYGPPGNVSSGAMAGDGTHTGCHCTQGKASLDMLQCSGGSGIRTVAENVAFMACCKSDGMMRCWILLLSLLSELCRPLATRDPGLTSQNVFR